MESSKRMCSYYTYFYEVWTVIYCCGWHFQFSVAIFCAAISLANTPSLSKAGCASFGEKSKLWLHFLMKICRRLWIKIPTQYENKQQFYQQFLFSTDNDTKHGVIIAITVWRDLGTIHSIICFNPKCLNSGYWDQAIDTLLNPWLLVLATSASLIIRVDP